MLARHLFCTLMLIGAVHAQTTWHVDDSNCPGPGRGSESDPFCGIQQAINASANNDTILVHPGTYAGGLNFLGRAIAVRSVSGPTVTIINGRGATRGVDFHSGEGRSSILEGFTITNCLGVHGSAISISGSSPTIRGNVVANNVATDCGAGMRIGELSSPLIEGNIVYGNTASWVGAGIRVLANSDPAIVRNTIVGNAAVSYGGGLELWNSVPTTIRDNIFWGNTANVGPHVGTYTNSVPRLTYCCVQGGAGQPWFGTGCITTDPQFASAPTHDYRLQASSPCIDAGDPMSPSDPDGSRADMGALYFHRAIPNFSAFGQACPGSGGPPRLSAASAPTIGMPFTLIISNLPPNSQLVVFLGFSDTNWGGHALPLDLTPFGWTGCSVFISLDAGAILGTGNGLVAWGFGIPYDPQVLGFRFYSQALVMDPGANPVGLTSTNGGRGTIGN